MVACLPTSPSLLKHIRICPRLGLLVVIEALEKLFYLLSSHNNRVFAEVFGVLGRRTHSGSLCRLYLAARVRPPVVHSVLSRDARVHIDRCGLHP